MSVIIKDFFQLGSLRLLTRFIKGLRGLFIITSLSPSALGEYTIWLLYFFYFSFFELGVSKGLERDLPHYKGEKDESAFQATANTGWSSFFYLSFMASLCLGIVSFIVFKQWVLALSLAGYLLAEKLYCAYDTNSRIFFQYRINGISELIQVVVGFILIYYYLPRYGIYSIFPCFIVSFIVGAVYLSFFCRLNFQWNFQIGKAFDYIKKTISLASMFYTIEIFNAIPMTIVALIWDKTTLGYYAFAFRIFQICLGIFPLLIREVIRTRMYFYMAEKGGKGNSFQNLIFPMSVYGLITSIFWLATYWWMTFIIYKFVPEYKSSVAVLNILIFSLLPLGINKISSDYLCSRVHNKMMLVNNCWILGIFFQIAAIFLANRIFYDIFNIVPMIYVLGTMMIYFYVVSHAFRIGGRWKESLFSMAYLLSPLAVAFFSVLLINKAFNGLPSSNIPQNACFSAMSIISTLVFSSWLIWRQMPHKSNRSTI